MALDEGPPQLPEIAAVGELLWDILPAGPRLGGAPANFIVFCARLGNRASLITSVGTDEFGRMAVDQLAQPGLDLRLVEQTAEHPTGTVDVSFSAANQPSYTIREGVAWDFITLTPAILNKAARVDAVCYGTLGQRDPVSRATVRRFVEATRAECVRVCDVNIRMPYCDAEVLRWSMQQATIIKISDEELPVVFHLLGLAKAPEKPGEAAQALAALFPGCSLVAMTLGAKGSLLAGREGTVTHPGFRIAPVDTVGAGDAFTAGLLHAYLWCQRQGSDGLSPANVLKMAEVGNLCGSFVASQPAATPPLSPELIQRIADLLRADDPAIS